MKDYYQILGIGDRASQQEIHDRWLELTAHCLSGLEGENQERTREINEAYETLRTPNLKFQYDLRRNFKRSVLRQLTYSREKRKLRLKKMTSYGGALAIFLLVGSFLFLFEAPWLSKETGRKVAQEGGQSVGPYAQLESAGSRESGKPEEHGISAKIVPPEPIGSESAREPWDSAVIFDPEIERGSNFLREASETAAKKTEDPGGLVKAALLGPRPEEMPEEPIEFPIVSGPEIKKGPEPMRGTSVAEVKKPEGAGGATKVASLKPGEKETPGAPKESPAVSGPEAEKKQEPMRGTSVAEVKKPEGAGGAARVVPSKPREKEPPVTFKESPAVSEPEVKEKSDAIREASVTAVKKPEEPGGYIKNDLLEPSRKEFPGEPRESPTATPPAVKRKSEPPREIPDSALKIPGLPARESKALPLQPKSTVIPEVAKAPTYSSVLPAISREREVRQFLAQYTDRYNHKDIDGFISFFSPKAVQNQKDAIEKIRKIYDTFFQQNEELRYKVRNVKIEPHKDGLQVKADYELEGILKKGKERKVWKGQVRWVLVEEKGALKVLSLDYQPQKSRN